MNEYLRSSDTTHSAFAKIPGVTRNYVFFRGTCRVFIKSSTLLDGYREAKKLLLGKPDSVVFQYYTIPLPDNCAEHTLRSAAQ